MTRILIVEDNADLAYGLSNNLEIEGYSVEVAPDGERGLELARASSGAAPDLIILDLMLPKLDGFRVLRDVRASGVDTPVLILTARSEEADKVRGFRIGADDYVTKPFGILELLARVDALLRRASGAAPPDRRMLAIERFGDVEVRVSERTVTRGNRSVQLTPKEFDLLVVLLRRQGTVASRVELIQEVWGYPASVVTRTVDTHIAELRRKLEAEPAAPRHILTVSRVGYRLVADERIL